MIPGSTNISSVIPICDTATDTITDVSSTRLGSMYHFLVPTGAPTRSFCGLNGGSTVNTFSSINHMKSTAWSLLAASQTGDAIGFRQLLRTTSFDTLELEIAMNYFVHSQSVNASFTCDLTNWSVRFWIVFLNEHKVFDILSVLADTHRTRSAAALLPINHIPARRIFFNRVSIPPHFEHFLWGCLTDTWIERT